MNIFGHKNTTSSLTRKASKVSFKSSIKNLLESSNKCDINLFVRERRASNNFWSPESFLGFVNLNVTKQEF